MTADDGAVPVAATGPEQILAELGTALAVQIVAVVPGWVESQVDRILDAWAATPAGRGVDRVGFRAAAAEAGAGAAEEVGRRLAQLAAADVDAQSTTPLRSSGPPWPGPPPSSRRPACPAWSATTSTKPVFPPISTV